MKLSKCVLMALVGLFLLNTSAFAQLTILNEFRQADLGVGTPEWDYYHDYQNHPGAGEWDVTCALSLPGFSGEVSHFSILESEGDGATILGSLKSSWGADGPELYSSLFSKNYLDLWVQCEDPFRLSGTVEVTGQYEGYDDYIWMRLREGEADGPIILDEYYSLGNFDVDFTSDGADNQYKFEFRVEENLSNLIEETSNLEVEIRLILEPVVPVSTKRDHWGQVKSLFR